MVGRKEAEARVIAKAWKDPKFRKALIRDPRSVLAKEFGVDIPADISIKVVEETADSLYLVLPATPAGVKGELSDLDLEFVAGGKAGPKPSPSPMPSPSPSPTPTACSCYNQTKQNTIEIC